jgi:hypothetical protein
MSVRVRCAVCMKEIECDVSTTTYAPPAPKREQIAEVVCHGKKAKYKVWWDDDERPAGVKLHTVYVFLGDNDAISFWPPIVKGKLLKVSDV